MKVLTVYAHHDPRSFCHGVLERFTAGLTDAGHTSDVVDLYAIKFDPVFRERDVASYIAADALAFVAPVHFCSFPSILKGWIDRVFTLDFAFGLTSEGWHGDINGRIPLLHHRRALIMTSTIFDKHAYDDGIRDAIAKVIDDWGFRFPGIDDVEHVYFYAATHATPDTIHHYLDQAYQLGRDFGEPRETKATPAAGGVTTE